MCSRVEAGDFVWGVNGHPLTAYPNVPLSRQLDLARDLGVTSYRVNVPTIDGVRAMAELVRLGRERGIAILPVLTPALNLEQTTAEVLYAQSFNFAVSLASRFKHEIRVWELGNELENYAILKPCDIRDDGQRYACSYGPPSGDSAADYVSARWKKVSAVLKGLSDGIVSVDPQLVKAMGAAGWEHFGAFERMQRDGIAWDVSVWHVYRSDNDDAFARLAAYRKPIWITEFNSGSGTPDAEASQVDGLRRIMAGIRAGRERFNIEAAFVYELLDEPYWAGSGEARMGLVEQAKDASGAWTPTRRKAGFETIRQTIAASRAPQPAHCDQAEAKPIAPTAAAKVVYGYCLVLGRMPDGIGLANWSHRLAIDLRADQLIDNLMGSAEFSDSHNPDSLNDQDFVGFAYTLLLQRIPDAESLTSYCNQLSSGTLSRRDLLTTIVKSDEFRARHAMLFADTPTEPVTAATLH